MNNDTTIYFDILSSLATVIFSGLLSGVVAGFVAYSLAKKKMKSDFTSELYKQRIASYTKIFGILESITRAKPTSEKIKEVDKKIHEWKKEGGILLLSEKSWKAFYELEEAISKRPGNGKTYTEAQVKNIWLSRNKFRGTIKMQDLGLYYSSENEVR